jgi:hypothetical protein
LDAAFLAQALVEFLDRSQATATVRGQFLAAGRRFGSRQIGSDAGRSSCRRVGGDVVVVQTETGADRGVEILGIDGFVQFLHPHDGVEEVEVRRIAAGEAAEPGRVADEAARVRPNVAIENGVFDGRTERAAEGTERPAVWFRFANERFVHSLSLAGFQVWAIVVAYQL